MSSMDLGRADTYIKATCIFNVAAVVLSLAAIGLTSTLSAMLPRVAEWQIHLFAPWILPGVLALPLLAVLALTTVMVYRRSLAAAIVLAVLYVLNRAFVFALLPEFGGVYRTIWLLVSLVWLLGFIPGVLGTLEYRRQRPSAAAGRS